jgi:3-hydroxyacyl-[acyl-carrier-protein] dehydratase
MTVPAAPVTGIARRLDADEVGRLLPHRHPFLLLDRVLDLDPPRRAVGVKNVAIAGVLIAAELMGRPEAADPAGAAQTGPQIGPKIGPETSPETSPEIGLGTGDGIGVLAEIKRFRFRHPVLPGDQVRLEVTLTSRLGRVREFACLASVAGSRAAHGTLVVVA